MHLQVLSQEIDDDENVTMIDFPQMVSVSHRNAQMYFDRDVECIFKFFRKRFNLSLRLKQDDNDEAEPECDEHGRPCFSSISKSTGSLDKKLAASGFTRKDHDAIEQFIGGVEEEDGDSSDSEDFVDNGSVSDGNDDSVVCYLDSLQLTESAERCDVSGDIQNRHCSDEISDNNEPETAQTVEKRDNSSSNEDVDVVLEKRLHRQRRKAVAAACGGRRAIASRNSYKDKGGKSSHNAKIQKQVNKC